MSDDDISLSEKRMYGQTRAETHAYVASGLGVTRVETAGGQIGRFSLAHRCSARDIAGILSENRRVLGMMPHPERAMEDVLGSTDGVGVFESMITSASRATG